MSPTDQRTGQSYYTIRVSMPPEEIARLGDGQADPRHAGRSLRADRRPHHAVLLMKPLHDQLMRAFPGEVTRGGIPGMRRIRPGPRAAG
jgi:HlyD family secretion protein